MMPRGPLADDWLYWDPVAIPSYPHSRDYDERVAAPEQLDLFERPPGTGPLRSGAGAGAPGPDHVRHGGAVP